MTSAVETDVKRWSYWKLFRSASSELIPIGNDRVREIMEKDAKKDPAVDKSVANAKILLPEVDSSNITEAFCFCRKCVI